jgi:hypothetical protein
VPAKDSRVKRGRILPDFGGVTGGVIGDILKAAEREWLAVVVARKEAVEHELAICIAALHEEIEGAVLDEAVAGPKLWASDVSVGASWMLWIGDEGAQSSVILR